jgi:hypothetical protein
MLLPISLRRFNILCLAAFVAATQQKHNVEKARYTLLTHPTGLFQLK